MLARVAAALAVMPLSVQADGMAGGMATRNENPVCRLYGLPQFGLVAEGSTGGGVGMAVDVANNSLDEYRRDEILVLDGETWGVRMAARHDWANGWGIALEVPFTSHQRGGLDDFIRDYHAALGLPHGNRRRRMPDQLEYIYLREWTEVFRVDEPATGIGDVRLAVTAPVWWAKDGRRALTAVATLKLPTGDAKQLFGSGSTDASLALAWHDRAWLSRWRMELDALAGAAAMTKGDILPDEQRPVAAAGSLALGWNMLRWLQPRIQVDTHSPLFREAEAGVLDEWAVELATGVRIRLGTDWALDVAVVEDLVVETTPDVVFHFAIRRNR